MEIATTHLDGFRLNYTVFGPDDGSAVVLSPPMFTNRTILYPLAAALAARGYRVLVLDHRGQGDNAPAASREELAIPALARDHAAFIEDLGEGAVHYIGAEQGGMVAGWLLAEHADLLRSVVVAGSSPTPEEQQGTLAILVEHLAAYGGRGKFGTTAVSAMIARRLFGEWTMRNHPALVDCWTAYAESLGPGIAEIAGQVLTRPALPDISDTGIPVLAIAGAEDTTYPAAVSGTGYAEATGGQTVLINRAGNNPLIEQPDLTAEAVLAFLSEVESA